MPSLGWAIMTGVFVYLLIASLAVIWFSLKRAKDRANEIVTEMTKEETVEVPETLPEATKGTSGEGGTPEIPRLAPRLIDHYNDLGLPVWPLVYQRYLVAAFAAVIALISLLGLLAHWPSLEEGRSAKEETASNKSEEVKKKP